MLRPEQVENWINLSHEGRGESIFYLESCILCLFMTVEPSKSVNSVDRRTTHFSLNIVSQPVLIWLKMCLWCAYLDFFVGIILLSYWKRAQTALKTFNNTHRATVLYIGATRNLQFCSWIWNLHNATFCDVAPLVCLYTDDVFLLDTSSCFWLKIIQSRIRNLLISLTGQSGLFA